MKVKINCIYYLGYNLINNCSCKDRKWFFGLLRDKSCCEETGDYCQYKQGTPRPKINLTGRPNYNNK